jgi:arylsulfatase A-like enzyme
MHLTRNLLNLDQSESESMRLFSVSLLSVACACSPSSSSGNAAIAQSNLVLVVVDTLRADHLGFHGNTRETSPFLDSIAEQSVVFERAYSPSAFTRESIASLLTGRLPSRSGSVGWYAAPSDEVPSLGTSYQAAGYRTGFFTATIMLGNPRYSKGSTDVAQIVSKGGQSGSSHQLTARTLQFVKECNGDPFMAYVHYFDPHGPYNPPEELQRKFTDRIFPKPLGLYSDLRPRVPEYVEGGFGPGNAYFEDMVIRYDAELLDTDFAIKALFDGLRELNVADETMVVITSDHGEEFLDHGFVEHAWTLYEESIHVPLLFWAPGSLAPARMPSPVSLVDIAPSVTGLQGISRGGFPTEGESLFDAAGLPIDSNRTVFSELLIHHRNVVRSVVQGDWKLIQARRWLSPAERSVIAQGERKHELAAIENPFDVWAPVIREELFNIAQDPGELKDLSETAVAELQQLRAVFVEFEEQVKAHPVAQQGFSDEEEIDEDTRKMIEDIGYAAGGSDDGH